MQYVVNIDIWLHSIHLIKLLPLRFMFNKSTYICPHSVMYQYLVGQRDGNCLKQKKLTAKCITFIVVDRDNVLMNKGMARKVKIS